MNGRVIFIITCLVFTSIPALARLRLSDGEYCFCNKSTNEIVVMDLRADGKELVGCGILVPNGQASVSDERMFPYTLPQVFQIEYQDASGTIHTDRLDTSWIEIKRARDGTIYFVFTPKQKFVLKLYLPNSDGDTGMRLDGLLLPDEGNPTFKAYKELVRASINGNAQRVRELLAKGTPYAWPNDPVSEPPLFWSVRWDRQKAFDVLINQLPKDYYPYDYYLSIQVATQAGYTNILKRLLQCGLAMNVPNASLQRIFKNACTHTKADPARANEIEVLKILLAHFKVGINYKTSDYGHTLLFVAVENDDLKLAKWLLSQGAHPNTKLQDGETTLNLSRTQVMRKLLTSYGAR